MRIILFAAARRGRLFLHELARIVPEARLSVCSFRETAEEPPFFAAMAADAAALGAEFWETTRTTDAEWEKITAAGPADLIFAVGWRYLIRPEIYRTARRGAFVFHDSLLPRSRGFSPTVWAIANGENSTGATLLEMAESADSGDIVDQEAVPIGPDEPIAPVMERVTAVYLELLRRNLASLAAGRQSPRPQDHSLATYCRRRTRADNRIDWAQPAKKIHDLIRAVSPPYSGGVTTYEGKQIRINQSDRCPDPSPFSLDLPGGVLAASEGAALIRCGDGGVIKISQFEWAEMAEVRSESPELKPGAVLGI